MAYGDYYDDQNGYATQPEQMYAPQAAPPPLFPSNPTAPPIYSGQPGSTYTGFDGQQGTVPTPSPVSSIDQPMWQQLWTQSGKNPQAFVQAVVGKLGLKGRQGDPTALNTILHALQAVGVNASLDQRTDAYHKGIMLNGQFVKLLDGSDNWMWGGNDGGQGGAQGGGYSIDPSYLAPYSEQFAAPPDAQLPNFQSPGAFKLPTADDLLKDPSYLWEEGRIRDSVQNSASAAGILNSTGTLDRIMGSVGDFARTNYNNVVNRDYGIWNSDWNHALDEYGAKTGRATGVYQRAMSEFDARKRQFQENQDRPFDKIFRGIDLGARAAAA